MKIHCQRLFRAFLFSSMLLAACGSPQPAPYPTPTATRPAGVPVDTASPVEIEYLLDESFEETTALTLETGSGARVESGDAHGGSQALRLDSTSTQGLISTQAGVQYKLTAWVRIIVEEGQDWGGFRLEVQDFNWNSLAHSGWLLSETHGSDWRKVAIEFTAVGEETRLLIGYFGGPGRSQTALLDDVRVFQKGENRPPAIQAQVSPTRLEELPGELEFHLTGEDPDGAITHIAWDFGDGTRAFTASGVKRAAQAGDFTGTVRVEDDEGGLTEQAFTWTAGDPRQPTLTLSGLPAETSQEVLSLQGTAGEDLLSVQISTDRGAWVTASGGSSWSAQLPLAPGWNRLLAQAADEQGRLVTAEALVRRVLPDPLQVSQLPLSAAARRWQPLEIQFQVLNSSATQPDFPYNPDPLPGSPLLDGITVDVLFSPDNWQTVYRRPAFYNHPYEFQERDGQEWALPAGSPAWTVRFSPPLVGEWRYRVEVSEAAGQTVSAEGIFQVDPPQPGEHGPLQLSRTDPRYFEFADGTPFLGAGYNLSFSPEGYSQEALARFDEIPAGTASLLRWWLGGSLWGSAWQPWNSMTAGYSGYLPYTGLSLENTYAGSLAAVRLDSDNPVMFQGWNSGRASIEPGQRYRLQVRWRTAAVSGPADPTYPYGLTLKFADWPEPGTTLDLPALIPHVSGDTPWHISTAEFSAQGDRLPGLALLLENTTGGAAYVDEISLVPLDGQDQATPQLLRGGRFNSHLGFDPLRAAGIERILQAAGQRGLFFRLVIGEKDEWLLNHLSPHGLPDPLGGNYFNGTGTLGGSLHAVYWRYLSARFGAYSSIHSWELVNETAPAPGAPFELAANLAAAMASDGNPHPASLSTWATLAENAWSSPAGRSLAPVDFHAYSNPIDDPDWSADSAAYYLDNAQAAAAAGFERPIIWGELGLLEKPGASNELPTLSSDTAGRWLHDLLWAQTGPAAVTPLIWFSDTVFANELHGHFGAWNRFMTGIPLNNGSYQDAAVKGEDANLRVVGQKDLSAGQAHLWIQNRGATWRALLEGQQPAPLSASVSIDMGQPGQRFQLTWVDTTTGEAQGTETLAAGTDGVLHIPVIGLRLDIALRIEPG